MAFFIHKLAQSYSDIYINWHWYEQLLVNVQTMISFVYQNVHWQWLNWFVSLFNLPSIFL